MKHADRQAREFIAGPGSRGRGPCRRRHSSGARTEATSEFQDRWVSWLRPAGGLDRRLFRKHGYEIARFGTTLGTEWTRPAARVPIPEVHRARRYNGSSTQAKRRHRDPPISIRNRRRQRRGRAMVYWPSRRGRRPGLRLIAGRPESDAKNRFPRRLPDAAHPSFIEASGASTPGGLGDLLFGEAFTYANPWENVAATGRAGTRSAPPGLGPRSASRRHDHGAGHPWMTS